MCIDDSSSLIDLLANVGIVFLYTGCPFAMHAYGRASRGQRALSHGCRATKNYATIDPAKFDWASGYPRQMPASARPVVTFVGLLNKLLHKPCLPIGREMNMSTTR